MDFFSRLSGLLGDALLPDDVRELLVRASDHLLRGDYAAAERDARTALARRPDLPRAHAVLGLARRALGDAEGACVSLREAVRGLPGEPALHLALAESELLQGELARALLEATRAREAGAPAADTALVLAKAHRGRGEVGAARAALEALTEASRPLEALPLLGALRLETGDAAGALVVFEEAARRCAPRPEIQSGRAEALLALGRSQEAMPHALQALSEAPRDARVAALVGSLHAASGNAEGAAAAFERALELAPRDVRVLLGAAAVAAAREDAPAARTFYERVLAVSPAEPTARAGLDTLSLRERLAAEAATREAGAQAAAQAAIRPDALYTALVRAQRLCEAAPELGELAPTLARLCAGYDRPLLLAIAGEFNAGKSTLLNALVGDAVAPMGVTPTTAAVNLFLYGPRKAARAVLRDGSAQELALADVAALVDARRGAGGAAVQHVEIVWPAEALREVNLVDTPGFNAAEEQHEAVARAFLAQADAVLWIFDASHAGSASERDAIAALGPLRGKVVGVLNKADRLAEAERTMVLEHLRAAFEGEIAAWTFVSARGALEARQQADEPALEKSGFPELWQLLESRFFAQARATKRETTLARLQLVLAEAQRRAAAVGAAAASARSLAQTRLEAARLLEHALADELCGRIDGLGHDALRRVVEETARAAQDAGRRRDGGLASLLTPRLPPAELDYLARIVRDRLEAELEHVAARASAEALRLGRAEVAAWREAFAGTADAAHLLLLEAAERTVGRAGEALRAGPFLAASSYLRGWLEGGRLQAAASTLAKAGDVAAAGRALSEALPARLPLREPFIAWARGFAAAFHELATAVQHRAERDAAACEVRLLAPLRALAVDAALSTATP